MKKITSIILVSSVLLSGCSYMPKWLTDLTSEGSELQNEAVQPEVVYYDTAQAGTPVEEGLITNDLNAIFYQPGTPGAQAGNLRPADMAKVPTRGNVNPGIANVPSNDVVYFAFDSSSMTADVKSKINFHIDFLKKNPTIRVVLEGHADERGSREYNLGLGELRALAVKDLMVLNGVNTNQVFVISYGEENPADPANNEAAWAKNRRVEVIYR